MSTMTIVLALEKVRERHPPPQRRTARVGKRSGPRRRSQLLQRALQQLQPILTPEDFARGQHVARRAEHASRQRVLRVLLMKGVEFGVRRAGGAQLRGIEPGALSG